MRSKRENVEAGAKEEQTSPPIHGAGVMDEEQIGRGATRPGEVGSRRPPLWTMGDHPAYIQAAGAGSTAAAPGGAAGNQAPMVQEARSYAGVSSAASSAPGSGNHDANSPARSFDTVRAPCPLPSPPCWPTHNIRRVRSAHADAFTVTPHGPRPSLLLTSATTPPPHKHTHSPVFV
jgi:hypothetical protein